MLIYYLYCILSVFCHQSISTVKVRLFVLFIHVLQVPRVLLDPLEIQQVRQASFCGTWGSWDSS